MRNWVRYIPFRAMYAAINARYSSKSAYIRIYGKFQITSRARKHFRETSSPRKLFTNRANQKNSLTRVTQPTQKLSMIPNDFKWLKLDPIMIFRVYGFKITWFHNHVVIQRVWNYRLDQKCLNNIIFRFFSHLEKINWCRIWSICYV